MTKLPITAILASCLLATAAHAASDDVSRNSPAAPERSQRNAPGPRSSDPEGHGMEKSAPARISKADRAFVTKAAGDILYEVDAARLAARHAQDPRLKQFAETLQQGDVDAQAGLKRISTEHNYPLPEELPADRQAFVKRLAGMPGRDFDSAFRLQVGVQDQRDAIKRYERALRSTQTPDIAQWIESRLPVLRSHLAAAQAMVASTQR